MTLNYLYPGSGTVAATTVQASQVHRQTGQVSLLTTDTTFTLTHNWGFDAAAQARLCPTVILAGIGSVVGPVTVASRSANTVVFDCAITVAGSYEFALDQPHSLIMPNV